MIMTALRKAERSYSHWGIFIVPNERVTIEMMDHGRVNDGYLSVFYIGDHMHKSLTPNYELQRSGPDIGTTRLAHDYKVLEQQGIDTDTIVHL